MVLKDAEAALDDDDADDEDDDVDDEGMILEVEKELC